MVRFSVIVPVYNIEEYLVKCVRSILDQTFDAYEILLVNDGSTDNSGEICVEFAQSSKKVHVIHQENQGLSAARNTGMREAKGEYLVFVDGDDFIEPKALSHFDVAIASGAWPDVLITRMVKFAASDVKFMDMHLPDEVMRSGNKDDIIKWMFEQSNNLWPAVRYVIKRSFVETNGLTFAKGYLHEDIDWTARLFLYAKTFFSCEYYWYNHRLNRKGSIGTTKNAKRTLDVIQLVSSNINDDAYKSICDISQRRIFNRMVSSVFSSLSDFKFYDSASKQQVVAALEEHTDIFEYTVQFRHWLFLIFSKMFGFRLGLFFMNTVHRVPKTHASNAKCTGGLR